MKTKCLFLLNVVCSLFSMIGKADQIPQTSVTLSERNKYTVIGLHNRSRCQVKVPAATMPAMTWNDRLFTVAQNYVNKCVFAHNANRSNDYAALGGQGYVGENIFIIWTGSQGIYLHQLM